MNNKINIEVKYRSWYNNINRKKQIGFINEVY